MKKFFSKIKNAAKKIERFVLVVLARMILVAIMGIYIIGCFATAAAFERKASVIDIAS